MFRNLRINIRILWIRHLIMVNFVIDCLHMYTQINLNLNGVWNLRVIGHMNTCCIVIPKFYSWVAKVGLFRQYFKHCVNVFMYNLYMYVSLYSIVWFQFPLRNTLMISSVWRGHFKILLLSNTQWLKIISIRIRNERQFDFKVSSLEIQFWDKNRVYFETTCC